MRRSSRHLRAEACYTELADVILSSARGMPVIYAPFTGDWGEALGRRATFQFFEAFGIEYKQIWRKNLGDASSGDHGIDASESCLVVAGGGAWSEHRSSARDVVAAHAKHFRRTIVLPCTIEMPAPVVDADVMYVRSDSSVSRSFVHEDALFCHDLAFFLDFEVDAPVPGDVAHGYFSSASINQESRRKVIGDGAIDLCALGSLIDEVSPLLKILAGSTSVRTDRAEVATAAALLGLAVEVFDGVGGREQALFEATLHGNYSQVARGRW